MTNLNSTAITNKATSTTRIHIIRFDFISRNRKSIIGFNSCILYIWNVSINQVQQISYINIQPLDTSKNADSASSICQCSGVNISTKASCIRLPVYMIQIIHRIIVTFSCILVVNRSTLEVSGKTACCICSNSAFINISNRALCIRRKQVRDST